MPRPQHWFWFGVVLQLCVVNPNSSLNCNSDLNSKSNPKSNPDSSSNSNPSSKNYNHDSSCNSSSNSNSDSNFRSSPNPKSNLKSIPTYPGPNLNRNPRKEGGDTSACYLYAFYCDAISRTGIEKDLWESHHAFKLVGDPPCPNPNPSLTPCGHQNQYCLTPTLA